MNKSTIFALAVALTTGVGTAWAQTSSPGSGTAPSGPSGSMPGPMPRDSGSSMGTGTMNPPTTVAPGTATGASPQAPVPGVTQPPVTQPSTAEPAMPTSPSTTTTPSMATTPPAGAMPGGGGPGEAQARAKIEADGYKNVGQLTRGSDGMWHGTAMRGASTVQVMVDPRGNVTSQ